MPNQVLFFNTYPFAVKTFKNESYCWVENVRTGERLSKKNLSKKEAEDIAQEKCFELITATGID